MIPLLLSTALASAAPDEDAKPTILLDDTGLEIQSADGHRALDFRLMAQLLATLTKTGTDPAAAEAIVKRARTQFRYADRQHEFALMVQLEVGESASRPLLDARLDWWGHDHVELGLGYMIVPYSRAWNTPIPTVVAGERSVVSNQLAPGRRTGGYARLHSGDRKVEGWLGVYDPGAASAPFMPLLMARVQVNPQGALPLDESTIIGGGAELKTGFGAAARIEKDVDGNTVTGALVDGTLQSGAFRVDADGALLDTADGTTLATSAQAAVAVIPDLVTLGARGSRVDEPTDGDRWIAEGFVNAYAIGPHLMVQVRYTGTFADEAPDSHQVALHTQAWF